jgi:hypothetical protein
MARKLFPFVFFFILNNLFADVQITEKEAGLDFRGEYNRALGGSANLSAAGALELNKLYTFSGGISLGDIDGEIDIKTFAQGRIGPLFDVPLYFSLAYIYNGLPAYENHSHTILPLAAFYGRWAGIGIGPGLRFTGFFGGKPLFESMISFAAYVNFVNNKRLCIGIGLANFSDFYAGTMGAYFLSLNSLILLNEHWSLINNIELLQSGSVALTANFYGIAYRGGFRFTW